MVYRVIADLIVLLHAGFVLFVVFGGFLVLWKPYFAWFHIPAAIWGAAIEFFGWICPLTPLENLLRTRGNGNSYATGFVEHYIMPVLYPTALTRKMQVGLGLAVLGINLLIYLVLWQKSRKNLADQDSPDYRSML